MNKSDSENKGQQASQSANAQPEIPTALVGPANVTFADMLRGSYMWLVALLCLMVAIGIVWWSVPAQGIDVIIHFPDGHGLKAEDVVRFRGIDVGVVEEVKLNRELSGVNVHVNLLPFAEPLAREGTRFWVVRPEFSLSRISGLETAVGSKYIGLLPGDPEGEWKTVFEGLAVAPPDALENAGIEILLRGEKRYSVTAGSPVSYRGVVIGRVLSVGLAPDGLKVDARLRIFEQYTTLVTSESKFWASSGIDASFSLSGTVELEMESLETLVEGGVSLLTIQSGGRPIKPGDDFVLHSSPNRDWYEQAQLVQSTNIKAHGALPLEVVWQQKRLLGMGKSDKNEGFVGAHVSVDGRDYALVPNDMLTTPEKAIEDSFHLGIIGSPDTRMTPAVESNEGISLQQLPDANTVNYPLTPFRRNETRIPSQPESCVAVRANGELDDLRYFPLRIDVESLDENWAVKNFDGDRSVWHGAPILSEDDGKLIGILVVGERETKIEILSDGVINEL